MFTDLIRLPQDCTKLHRLAIVTFYFFRKYSGLWYVYRLDMTSTDLNRLAQLVIVAFYFFEDIYGYGIFTD